MERPKLIVRTRTTPPASEKDAARFRVLVLPDDRSRALWGRTATVGDALDTAPDPCRYRYAWYSAARGEVGLMTKSCGAPSCPACVPSWLVERIAPAWAVWGGQADVAVVRGGHDSNREYARLGVRFRGRDATPGALSVERPDGGRAVIAPAGSFAGGTVVRGMTLDRRLVATLRALRVDRGGGIGTTPGPSRIVPAYVTADAITAAASAAGFSLNGRSRFARSRGRTRDDFDVFWSLLTGRAA